ncbi:hypothetical protein ABK040_002423 [Willaertia magna]
MSNIFLFGSCGHKYITFDKPEFNYFTPILTDFYYSKVICGARIVGFKLCGANDEYLFFGLTTTKQRKITLTNIKTKYKEEFTSYFVKLSEINMEYFDAELFLNQSQEIILSKRLNCLQFGFGNRYSTKPIYFKSNIKMFVTGPLSSNCYVITEDNKVYEDGMNIKFDGSENIINATANGGGCIILTEKGNIYVYGSNTFQGLSPDATKESFEPFTLIETPFTKLEKSNIIAMTGGYYHTLYLLENGKIYGNGYNCSRQVVGVHDSDVNTTYVNNGFEVFNIPKKRELKINKIGASSRGSFVVDEEKKKIMFIGEVVENFSGYQQKEGYFVDLREVFGENNLNYNRCLPNEVVPGGWHYVIGYNEEKRQLIGYGMMKKLKEFVVSSDLNTYDRNLLFDCEFIL